MEMHILIRDGVVVGMAYGDTTISGLPTDVVITLPNTDTVVLAGYVWNGSYDDPVFTDPNASAARGVDEDNPDAGNGKPPPPPTGG